MSVLDGTALIVGYAALLAGAYFVVVYVAAGAVVWLWRRWSRRPPTPAPVEPVKAPAVHRAPSADDNGFTPCCGLTVFELPRSDRITADHEHVTCGRTQ